MEHARKEQLIMLRRGMINYEGLHPCWTKIEADQLLRCFWQGYDLSDMALTFKRTEIEISNELFRLGIILWPEYKREENAKQDFPAHLTQEREVALIRKGLTSLPCAGTEWTAGELRHLKELFKIGWGLSKIALILRRAEIEVIGELIELGLLDALSLVLLSSWYIA